MPNVRMLSDEERIVHHRDAALRYNSKNRLRYRDLAKAKYYADLGTARMRRRIQYYVRRDVELLYQKLKYQIGGRIRSKKNADLRKITKALIEQVYERNIARFGKLTCYLCCDSAVEGDKDLHPVLEHKIPVCRGGLNELENLDVAHKRCNYLKGKLTEDEYRKVSTRARV